MDTDNSPFSSEQGVHYSNSSYSDSTVQPKDKYKDQKFDFLKQSLLVRPLTSQELTELIGLINEKKQENQDFLGKKFSEVELSKLYEIIKKNKEIAEKKPGFFKRFTQRIKNKFTKKSIVKQRQNNKETQLKKMSNALRNINKTKTRAFSNMKPDEKKKRAIKIYESLPLHEDKVIDETTLNDIIQSINNTNMNNNLKYTDFTIELLLNLQKSFEHFIKNNINSELYQTELTNVNEAIKEKIKNNIFDFKRYIDLTKTTDILTYITTDTLKYFIKKYGELLENYENKTNDSINKITFEEVKNDFNEIIEFYKIMDILDNNLIIKRNNVGTTTYMQILIDQKDNFMKSLQIMKFIKETTTNIDNLTTIEQLHNKINKIAYYISSYTENNVLFKFIKQELENLKEQLILKIEILKPIEEQENLRRENVYSKNSNNNKIKHILDSITNNSNREFRNLRNLYYAFDNNITPKQMLDLCLNIFEGTQSDEPNIQNRNKLLLKELLSKLTKTTLTTLKNQSLQSIEELKIKKSKSKNEHKSKIDDTIGNIGIIITNIDTVLKQSNNTNIRASSRSRNNKKITKLNLLKKYINSLTPEQKSRNHRYKHLSNILNKYSEIKTKPKFQLVLPIDYLGKNKENEESLLFKNTAKYYNVKNSQSITSETPLPETPLPAKIEEPIKSLIVPASPEESMQAALSNPVSLSPEESMQAAVMPALETPLSAKIESSLTVPVATEKLMNASVAVSQEPVPAPEPAPVVPVLPVETKAIQEANRNIGKELEESTIKNIAEPTTPTTTKPKKRKSKQPVLVHPTPLQLTGNNLVQLEKKVME
jgi:hypothetical protein